MVSLVLRDQGTSSLYFTYTQSVAELPRKTAVNFTSIMSEELDYPIDAKFTFSCLPLQKITSAGILTSCF